LPDIKCCKMDPEYADFSNQVIKIFQIKVVVVINGCVPNESLP